MYLYILAVAISIIVGWLELESYAKVCFRLTVGGGGSILVSFSYSFCFFLETEMSLSDNRYDICYTSYRY